MNIQHPVHEDCGRDDTEPSRKPGFRYYCHFCNRYFLACPPFESRPANEHPDAYKRRQEEPK